MLNRIVGFITILMCSIAWGQTPSTPSSSAQSAGQQSMPGMSGHDMSTMQMKDMPTGGDKDAESDASAHVMKSMEGHMDMGPHMKMTALRQPKPGDAARAQQVAEEARKASEKYTDYHAALADGYKIFHPEVPQTMYHFTNYGYALEARFRFNPEHPTSLLYEKHGDDYKLIGAMYTAPKRYTEDQLDERVPLSVAQWHEHVNFCAPPADRKKEALAPHPQFGLRGSITTQEACDAAGGTFHPVIFNWMVHVYPFEKDQANVWSVERQHGDAD
ncbi:MAG: hypothetical protein ABR881_02115 [Candidatus Sulfotelmatobacter sp.]|jgi:hypothetical protein